MAVPVSSNETPISSLALYSFSIIDGDKIGDDQLDECAKFFSANYGVWGQSAGPALAGKRVKMSARKLREECLPIPQSSALAICLGDGKLLGQAFATVWKYDGETVGWVTQLVVDATVRKRGIATQLLRSFKSHKLFADVTAVGLASTHPASVAALAKYSNGSVDKVDFKFITESAVKVLDSTPINYLKSLKPSGALFEEDGTTGNVSSVFTRFFVDHSEPLDVLNVFKASGRWHFGDLPEGHEFLIIVRVASI